MRMHGDKNLVRMWAKGARAENGGEVEPRDRPTGDSYRVNESPLALGDPDWMSQRRLIVARTSHGARSIRSAWRSDGFSCSSGHSPEFTRDASRLEYACLRLVRRGIQTARIG
jgi:hypothetical protein